MGAIHSSISTELLKFLSLVSPIKTFVETGTFHGDTVELVAPFFDEVYSVEISEELHTLATKRFVECPNIRIEHGHSPKFLEDRMEEFSSKPVLFWLDAHSCHDCRSSGGDVQTPVLRELEAIKSLHPASIILIDDALLYLCAQPKFHFVSDWPDIDDLIRRLYQLSECHRLIVLDDVIVFYPGDLRTRFSEFSGKNGVNWLNLAFESKIAQSLFSKVIEKKRKNYGKTPGDDRKMDISVVIPSLDCIQFLPDHLDSIESWLSQVREVVVVDSYSTDGTLEAFKRYLDHPNLKILSHPRGLYQSWNFGIQQTTSKFVYVSTVGDSINREHLELLENLALKSNADVVISPPRFIDREGVDVDDVWWPIQSILDIHPGIDEIQLGPLAAFLLSAASIPCSILGSSASNLYRGEFLRERPFPDDCSVIGDTAWSLLYSLEAKFHFTTEVGSTFRLHTTTPDLSKSGSLHKVVTRLLSEAERLAMSLQNNGVVTKKEHKAILDLIHGNRSVADAKEGFTNARRKSVLPWFFSKDLRKSRKHKKTAIVDFLNSKSYLNEILKSNR